MVLHVGWLSKHLGAVVRALVPHQSGPDSIPGPGAICGLSLLLVLYSAPRGFSPGTPVFPSPQKPTCSNSNLILECTGISNKFLWTPGAPLVNKLHLHFIFFKFMQIQVSCLLLNCWFLLHFRAQMKKVMLTVLKGMLKKKSKTYRTLVIFC